MNSVHLKDSMAERLVPRQVLSGTISAMGGANFRSAILISLSFVIVVAFFHALVFQAFWGLVEVLRDSRGLTNSERRGAQILFWFLYGTMLVATAAVPTLVARARRASVQMTVAFLAPAWLVFAITGLAFQIFLGSCTDLFSAFSC